MKRFLIVLFVLPAAAGGPQMSVALAGQMAITLLGSSGALWLVNRWR
jgi:hypothetical protein